MTIEWLSSKRMQGVTADTKPTNVPTGTEFMNTQTRVLSVFNGTTWDDVSGGGGATNLDALTDVDLTTTSPVNGDVLTYTTTGTKWIPAGAASGAVTASSVTTFTNKTYDADATGNSISNIENADIKATAAIATSKLADNTNFILKTLDNSFGAHYHDITKMTAPSNPGANDIRLYVDTADTHLKIKNNAGTVVDLHSVSAPSDAQYVTLTTNSTLSNERTLAVGPGITLTDGGANNPVALGADTTGLISTWSICETDFIENRSNAIFDDWPNGTAAGVFGGSSETNAIGVWTLSTGTDTTGRCALITEEEAFQVGGATLTFIARVRFPDLSVLAQRYIARIGFGDSISGESTDGVYFEYDESTSVNWRMVTANNTTRTKATSTTAVPSNTWVWIKIIINSAGTSAAFYVNGTQLTNSPIATNLPGAGRMFGSLIQIVKSAGTTNRDLDIDYAGTFAQYSSSRGTF